MQITDSDFARQFKAFVKKKLHALRHDFQHAQKNTSSVFKAVALEIVTSAVWVQQKMSAKNWQDQLGNPTLRKASKADWNLSDSAKTISDLQRWDYYNPGKDAENDLEEGLELDGDLVLELAELPQPFSPPEAQKSCYEAGS